MDPVFDQDYEYIKEPRTLPVSYKDPYPYQVGEGDDGGQDVEEYEEYTYEELPEDLRGEHPPGYSVGYYGPENGSGEFEIRA